MERLNEFTRWFNEELFLESLAEFDISYYLHEVKFSARRQLKQRDKQRAYVGASALSKPDVLLALMYLGYPHLNRPYTLKTAMTFHLGDVFEAVIVSILNAYGLRVTKEQTEIQIPDTPVLGHIDGVIEELDAVIEVKTMAASYFKSFVKEPNNYRGYYTQLAIYKQTMGCSNAFWVCFNKETSEVAIVYPEQEKLDEYWESAKTRGLMLNTIKGVEDVGAYEVPNPKPEMFKKEETGKLMLPMSMRYTPYVDCFYDIYEAKDKYKHNKTYVSRVINNADERLYRIEKKRKELIETYGNPE